MYADVERKIFMRLITISREFGSGGRELGKRLADALKIPCYDQQIIEMVAEKENLDRSYVANMSEKELMHFYPTTIARGFSKPSYVFLPNTQVMSSEHTVLRNLANGGDCLIVGRAADIVLADKKPFRIFVFSDNDSKLLRCRSMADTSENLTDKEMLSKCREIDKRRASYRKMFTDKKWGDATAYDLCVNTSGKSVKSLVPAIAEYINNWYSEDHSQK